MTLVIGGAASGKRTYVKTAYGYADADMADAVLDGRPVLFNLQNMLKDPAVSIDALLDGLRGKAVVICNEVGGGIIPLDKSDRAWRDAVGRVCVLLARDADRLVRMVCGIPIELKG